MIKVARDKWPGWPKTLLDLPDTKPDEWHEMEVSEAGAIRQAISRDLKYSHPHIEFITKFRTNEEGTRYLGVKKITKSS